LDADRWTARERGNCKAPGKELQLSAGQRRLIAEKEEMYKALIESSTQLGDEGEVQKSAAAMAQAQDIKAEIEDIKSKCMAETGGEAVCEACGVRYPLGDLPTEVGDRNSHFAGKTHEAYTTIRQKVNELREKKKSGEWEKALDGGKDQDRKKDGGSGGGEKRSRSRQSRP